MRRSLRTSEEFRRDVENGGDLGERRKKRRQESIGSVDFDPGYQKNRKEAEREAQGAQGLNENCRGSVSPLWGLSRAFRNKSTVDPPWGGPMLFFFVSHLWPMGLNVLGCQITYCNVAILPGVTKDLPISPRFSHYEFLSRYKVSTFTSRQPMVGFLLTHVLTLSTTDARIKVLL